MSTGRAVHRLHYGAYLALSRGIRCLPHRVVRRVGRAFGRVAYRLMGGRRRLTLDNLAGAFPALDSAERDAIGRGCFEHYGGAYLEALSVARYQTDEMGDLFTVEGLHHLQRAQQLDRGVFIFTGHYGSLELTPYPLAQLVDSLHLLVRRQNNPYVAEDVDRFRLRTGAALVPRRRSAHRMLNILRAKGTIALAVDQRVRPSEGVLIPFLGRLAWTTSIPAQLAVATGSPAVPVFCVPTGNGGYRLTFHEAIEPQAKGEAEVVRLTRRYMEAIEKQVALAPEMWLWPHTRWQRSARHRWPEVIARLESTANLGAGATLDELATRPATSSTVRKLTGLVGDDDFFEQCRHIAMAGGSRPQRTEVVTAFGRAVVASGYGVLYTRLDELLASLRESRDREQLPTRLRKDDARALMIVDGAELHTLDEGAIELLGIFLEHRRARGCLLVAADVDGWQLAETDGLGAGEIRTFLDCAQSLTLPPPTSAPSPDVATERPPALEAESDTPAS